MKGIAPFTSLAALFVALLSPNPASAGVIRIKTVYNPDGTVKIEITGDQKSRIVQIVPNAAGAQAPAGGGMTDANGKASIAVNAPAIARAGSVNILISDPADGTKDENFSAINRDGTYTSQEQKTVVASLGDPGTLPFVSSNVCLFSDPADGTQHVQFEIANRSQTAAYQFTALQAYTGVDASFFNPTDFHSPAAIASGVSALNLTGASIPVFADQQGVAAVYPANAPVQPRFLVTLPLAGPPSLDEYTLLVGQAAGILSDGSLGPAVPFAIAHQPVPEPLFFPLLLMAVPSLRRLRRP